jgi:DNA-directed RNA polymerase specialized sigma24 family protein
VARSRTRGKSRGSARDAGILQAIFANEPDAWRKFLDRYAPAVRTVVRLVFDRYHEPVAGEDVDEVVEEVFGRVAEDGFQWLAALRTPEMLDPSIRALAAWRTLGLLRAKYRVFTCSLESEAKIGGHHVATAILARPPDKERAPYLVREEVDRMVEAFLEKIGARPARLLKSLYEFRKSYAEMAERDGMPLASVAQTMYEERKRFAERLAEAAPEAGL